MDHLYHNNTPVDSNGRIRIDDWEMRDDVQNEVAQLWQQVSSENLEKISDIQGYRSDFYKLFGFGLNGVDYNQDVDVNVNIPSIPEE